MSLCAFVGCKEQHGTQVIAHRGAWKSENLPENSIASLNKAIELGCYGAEFDVHLTKDEVPVVNHDADFEGMEIETSTYQELLKHQLSNGEHIPTLKDYLLQGLQQKDVKLIVEIKTSPSGDENTLKLTRLVLDMVTALEADSMVAYICFNYKVGKLIHQLKPKAEVAYLNGDLSPSEVKKVGYTGINYNYKVYKKHPNWIREAKELGMTVNSWTVNKQEEMKVLIAQDIDYITTNEPEMLVELLNR